MGACCSSNPTGIATISKELKSKIINKTTVKVIHGDITQENVDAIVNSTNTNLHLKAGVAEAILSNGGS